MKKLILGILIAASGTAFAQDKAKVKAAADSYKKDGKELLAMLNTGKVDEAKAEKLANNMMDQAVTAAKEYIAKDKKSEKLLNYIIAGLPEIKSASFETLEKDWHDAGKLTKDKVGLDLKAEENEKYMDPVHSILHPAMTLRAIKDKKLKEAKDELTEGMEQMDLQAKYMTK